MKSVVFVLVAGFVAGSFCAVVREAFVCKRGVPYMENQCNECFCVKQNDFVCSAMKCPQNAHLGLENCATGSVWQERCNKCWCTNVGTVCTNHRCS